MLRTRFHSPSPAMVVALLALFVSLSGVAVGSLNIVPLAKKARVANVANNAKRLQHKTVNQVAARPSPASTAVDLVSVKETPFALNPGELNLFTVTCDTGQKALSGGYTTPGIVLGGPSALSADGRSWAIVLGNTGGATTGVVYAFCLR
jgi:hypothetical protein